MTDYHDAPTRGLFAREVLRELGYPKTAKNMVALLAWQEGEGTRARNNPLATTKAWPRATAFNSVGVKNYATFCDGVLATVATLKLAPYHAIRVALQAGTSVHAAAHAIEASPWGTQRVPWRPVAANVEQYAAKLITS